MRIVARLLVVAAVAWLAAIVTAPLAIASSHPLVAGAAAVVYSAAGFICHQRPERSFHLHGLPLAVCARCTGLYAAAALGAPLGLALSLPRASRARLIVVAAGLPTVLTWGAEMVGLAHPTNLERALAALPLGAVVAWILVAAVRSPESRMI